jgi:hypothetical protein
VPALAGTIHILEADPDIGARLPAAALADANQAAVAAVVEIERGPWVGMPSSVDPGAIGFLVLEGIIALSVEVAGRTNVELVGPGDIIRPWTEGPEATLPQRMRWNVIVPVRLAWLDREFALRTGRWPEIGAALMQRLVQRANHLLFQRALAAIPRVDERLLLLLWDFADRFGRVRADGVHLPLPMSHSLLAGLVAAQRPSVTTALGKLRRAGSIEQVQGVGWLLRGDAPVELAAAGAGPLASAA